MSYVVVIISWSSYVCWEKLKDQKENGTFDYSTDQEN